MSTKNTPKSRKTRTTADKGVVTVTNLTTATPEQVEVVKEAVLAEHDTDHIVMAPGFEDLDEAFAKMELAQDAAVAAQPVAVTPAPQAANDVVVDAPVALSDVSAPATVVAPAVLNVKGKGRTPTGNFKGFGKLINYLAGPGAEIKVVLEHLKAAGCKNPEGKFTAHVNELKSGGLQITKTKGYIQYNVSNRSGHMYF